MITHVSIATLRATFHQEAKPIPLQVDYPKFQYLFGLEASLNSFDIGLPFFVHPIQQAQAILGPCQIIYLWEKNPSNTTNWSGLLV